MTEDDLNFAIGKLNTWSSNWPFPFPVQCAFSSEVYDEYLKVCTDLYTLLFSPTQSKW